MSLLCLSAAMPLDICIAQVNQQNKNVQSTRQLNKNVSTSNKNQRYVTTKNIGSNTTTNSPKKAGSSINKSALAKLTDENTRQQIERKLFGGSATELIVIHDSGNTVSIDNYYLENPEIKPKTAQEVKQLKTDIDKGLNSPQDNHINQIQKSHFPVSAKSISFSAVGKKQVLRSIPQLEHNLFVIGDDKYSLKWLEFNKAELIRFGAVGILTQVKSMARFQELIKQVKPLSLMPVSGDFIKEEFGVNNYPVLITKQGEFR